jgi:hypothetical protein
MQYVNLWPLLTPIFLDPLRQVRSLCQPPKPSQTYGWRISIIYPVKGPIVKGILAGEGCQTPRPRRLQERLLGSAARRR